MSNQDIVDFEDGNDIAIIGMAGRFPMAGDLQAFWQILKDGVEAISFFSDEEMEANDLTPEELSSPNFVKARAIIEGVEMFDAPFFNIPAREAEWMDPQQRLFLECAWSAIENAGYNISAYKGLVAVYSGVSVNTYLLTRAPHIGSIGDLFKIVIANDKDHLSTRVSYKLNLRGESVTVQSACSTSLVATHLACQSLLSGQCDMALAGAVAIRLPQKTGYVYQEGMISSPDGHCRAFDARAQGTVSGNGLGVVVLKRLEDALRDRDCIRAVIKGSVINNDGHMKVGYTAPSVEGQADVISKALAMAGVSPDTISYVEAHGTGTILGDPIEIEALTKAYRQWTDRKQYCTLGAVKTNIGHLDTAAGVAGLIKTVLALEHEQIPPTLHFEKPNPALELENSPFVVGTSLSDWKRTETPRRAGVSSFGMGGTNAHLILEEAPLREASDAPQSWQLLPLSAKTPNSLAAMASGMASHLSENGDLNIADVAYTLAVGRQHFQYRQFVLAEDCAQAAELFCVPIHSPSPGAQTGQPPLVAFLFPGQGAQSLNMARELYSREAAFRTHVDACAQILGPHLGLDLREVLYPSPGAAEQGGGRLDRPEFALPALFTIEYALAQLWMSYGIRPQAMLGHSHGEYVAACMAGVFSLADALKLVAARGRLIGRLEPGAMLAVRAPEDQATGLMGDRLSLAAVNSRNACVVTGPVEEVEEFKRLLDENRIGHKDLPARHAYHSDMVDPILDEFAAAVEEVEKKGPAIPYISSLTGTWIRPEQTMDARYWTSQMRYTVRFADGLETLAKENFAALVETGPEHTLCALARQHLGRSGETLILPSLSRSGGRASDLRTLLDTMGRLWMAGVEVDWPALYRDQARNRLPLPTYQFDRRRYWIEAMLVRRAENEVEEERAEAAAAGQTARVDFAARSGQASSRHPVDRSRLQSDYAEPQTDLEVRLVEIWGEVLGLEGIGAQDNFFDLGGDSLLATQVYSRIQQIIPASVSVRDILSYQTVAEFASAIAELPDRDRSRTAAQSELRPVPRDQELPLSFSQQRLWFLDQTTPGSPVYNLSIAVWLSGELSFAALQRSIDEVVRRHESLRTTFATVEGQPVQVIARELKLPLTVVDLTELTESAREEPMQAMMAEMIDQPFDLATGPLLRLYLLRLGEQDQVALFVTHHVVSDAWSLGVFIREIALLYDSFCKGMPSPLPELEIQYADFAYWQRKWLQGEMLEKQVNYWKRQLGGKLAVLNLPTDRPRPPIQTTRGATVPFILPTALTDGLRELSRSEGVTLFMTLLAGLQTLLYRYSGQDDIVVGAPSAGRTRPETEPLIGFFINMLVLRTDFSNNPQFKELLHRVEETMLGAFANQDVPFEKLVEVLQPERDLSRTPLFQVLFNFMNTPAPPVDASGLTMMPIQVESKVARFDLLLNITEMPDGLACSLQYNTDLFDAATVEKMIAHFETLLGDVVARPEGRVDSLEMLTAEEKERLAEEQARLEKTHIAKLRGARRKAISFSQEQLVKTGFLNGDHLPLVIEPEIDEVNLIGWIDKGREQVERLLLKHGAILFRGFRSVSASNLRQLAEALTPELLDYNYRSTPRTVVDDKVYTSTEYPAHQSIPLHNENAYTRSWPMKLWFYCDQPASEGGETPIADSRRLFRLLDPKITKRFIEKGITYVRNYGEGLDLSWQEVFQTSDRGEVERFCRAHGMEFEWKDGERLRTRQLCQAIASHPKTGETVWFNQAHLFHMSSLGEGFQNALLGSFREEDLPRNAYYGDGSRIEASVLDEVRAAYQQAATVFAWREGDVLMVDNMLVAHGRNPYVGPRRVLVVMAEPYGIPGEIAGSHSQPL